MNSTNRFVNRALLFITGLVLLVVAAVAVLRLLPIAGAQDVHDRVTDAMEQAGRQAVDWSGSWGIPLPDGRMLDGTAILAGGGGLIVAVLLVVFLSTRGGGRARTVLSFGGDEGTTRVDASVADAVLSGPLGERSDVLSSRAQAFRVHRAPAIRLAIVPRSGARLPEILTAADAAVEEWDGLAGARLPVLVHLADRGGLDRLRAATRVR
ncbi:hypothetical protein J2Y69_002620 [Microbacterium resistens]|uniref:Alkaline shock response membrane anchor protein AmaP n=1 Tax=Microbacterium resistens TaxID=156977 RepID=A0ABU1SGM4_9MICO|nr:hypothetical protein [Microbacterium resistens]MDR6868012.1 hypothetical protein [Microbacterium resistens]